MHEHRGQSLTELALVLPFLMLLIMATVDIARFAMIDHQVSYAARQGARLLEATGARSPDPDPNIINGITTTLVGGGGDLSGLQSIVLYRANPADVSSPLAPDPAVTPTSGYNLAHEQDYTFHHGIMDNPPPLLTYDHAQRQLGDYVGVAVTYTFHGITPFLANNITITELTNTRIDPDTSGVDAAPPAGVPTPAPTPTSFLDTPTAGPTATPATLTYVQGTSTTPQSPLSTVSLTYDSPQSGGDTNILAIGWNSATAHIVSVSDSAGNAYQVAVPLASSNSLSQAIYYAPNIASASSNTVTVTFDQAVPYADIRAMEYSGLDPVSPFDVGSSGSGLSGQADSGSATTTNASDLLVGAGMTGGGFPGAGTGYTSRMITNPDEDIVEDQGVSATGSYNATAPDPGNAWIMQMAAFRTAGPAPTPTP